MRFGVPDFKIEKWVVERRLDQLRAEGVDVRCGVDVGVDVTADQLRAEFDAVVLTIGSRVPRDLPVPGRELDGIHPAMDYLYVRNRAIADELGPEPSTAPPAPVEITAAGKHVIVIGGGDTGADCVGHSIREGALSVTQLELLPEPPTTPPRRPHAVAAVAAEVPVVLRHGRGDCDRQGRAGLLDRHDPLRRRGRPRGRAALRPGRRRAAVRARRGHRRRDAGRPRPAGDGLPAPRARGHRRAARRRPRPARQHQGLHLRDLGPRRLRRRRRPPRPVADRLGDQRGPPGRPHGRPLPARAHRHRARARAGRQRPRRRRGSRGPAEARGRRRDRPKRE